MPVRLYLAGFLCLAALVFAPAAHALTVDDLVGIYVGVTEDYDGEGHKLSSRHVDMVITKRGDGGFELALTSVKLIDGRRDVPGVRRRAYTAIFKPTETETMFVADQAYDPFEERSSEEMFTGEPLEWAQFTEEGVVIFTLAVLEDGRYEKQTFERVIDGEIIRTLYERRVDGALQRRTIGQMVRSE